MGRLAEKGSDFSSYSFSQFSKGNIAETLQSNACVIWKSLPKMERHGDAPALQNSGRVRSWHFLVEDVAMYNMGWPKGSYQRKIAIWCKHDDQPFVLWARLDSIF